MSLSELSRRSGVSKGYLSQLENESIGSSPTAGKLEAIARALGVGVSDLLGAEVALSPALSALVGAGSVSPREARMLALVEVDGMRPEGEEEYEAVYQAIRQALVEKRARDR